MSKLARNIQRLLLVMVLTICLPIPGAVTIAQEEVPVDTQSIRFSLLPAADPGAGFIDDLVVEPDSSATAEVIVQNTGDASVHLRLYMTNAGNATNGGFRAGTFDEEPSGSTVWIVLDTHEVELEPGQQQILTLGIAVPPDAAPGQYISALVAETADTMPIPGATALDHRIRYAMSVGIIVPGELTPSFELGDPVVSDNAVRIPISNDGNYLVRPEGEVRLINDSDEAVIQSELQLGSIYASNTTEIAIAFPEQLPSGDYVLEMTLTDPDSGVSREIQRAELFVPEPVDPTGLSVTASELTPVGDPMVLMDVNTTITNGGNQIPAANVVLEVSRDGEVVELFPLATNQILFTGENQFNTRYIPEDGSWEPGAYTFSIIVSSVNPNDGQEIQLLDQPLEDEIAVP